VLRRRGGSVPATGVSLFGYTLPTAAEVGIVCVFAVVFITLSVAGFGKPE